MDGSFIFNSTSERNDLLRIGMGMLAGLTAAWFATPFDFVRTVQQVCFLHHLLLMLQAHVSGNSSGISGLQVVREVTRKDGIPALWRGCSALLARAAVFTAAQLVSYDESKFWVSTHTGWGPDDTPTHMTASLVSGVFTTLCTAPLEMVKTHMQVNSKKGSSPSFWPAFKTVVRTEGVLALWRGTTPLYLKVAPHTFIVLVLTEQFRALFGVQQVM